MLLQDKDEIYQRYNKGYEQTRYIVNHVKQSDILRFTLLKVVIYRKRDKRHYEEDGGEHNQGRHHAHSARYI